MEITAALKVGIALTLKLTNIVLHGVGFYLLRCVQKHSKHNNVQMVYITNLSIIELMVNILSFIRNLFGILPVDYFETDSYKNIKTYTYMMEYTVLKFNLYMTMILLTLDRLVLISLNVKYSTLWNVKKTHYLTRGMWLFGLLLFILTTLLYNNNATMLICNNEIAKLINCSANMTVTEVGHRAILQLRKEQFFFIANYLTISFDVLFVLISIGSYTMIFNIFRKRQRKVKVKKTGTKIGLWKTFRGSRFYVSLLLIMTFVVFVIPADIVWIIYSTKSRNEVVELLTTISYAISYLSDGLIYIFMNNKVKRLFETKIISRICRDINLRKTTLNSSQSELNSASLFPNESSTNTSPSKKPTHMIETKKPALHPIIESSQEIKDDSVIEHEKDTIHLIAVESYNNNRNHMNNSLNSINNGINILNINNNHSNTSSINNLPLSEDVMVGCTTNRNIDSNKKISLDAQEVLRNCTEYLQKGSTVEI